MSKPSISARARRAPGLLWAVLGTVFPSGNLFAQYVNVPEPTPTCVDPRGCGQSPSPVADDERPSSHDEAQSLDPAAVERNQKVALANNAAEARDYRTALKYAREAQALRYAQSTADFIQRLQAAVALEDANAAFEAGDKQRAFLLYRAARARWPGVMDAAGRKKLEEQESAWEKEEGEKRAEAERKAKIEDKRPEARRLIAEAAGMIMKRQYSEALAKANEATNLVPGEPDYLKVYWTAKSQVDFNDGRYSDAVSAAKEVLRLDPSNKEAQDILSMIRTKRGQASTALGSATAQAPATSITVGIQSRGEFFIQTKDGRKLKGHEGGWAIEPGSRVVTGPASRVELQLPDRTMFVVGPGSDMVIDEFVYDPVSTPAKVTARIVRGIFRFITGTVARRQPPGHEVVVPSGVIGIRGTEFECDVDSSGSGAVKLYSGEFDFTPFDTGTAFTMKTGQMIEFDKNGKVSGPMPIRD